MSVRLRDGQAVRDRPLRQVTASLVVTAAPWPTARSARGQAHYPGWYWSATSGCHVIYESRLELARLLLADFDPDVVAVAAQPFLLRAPVGRRVRRHVLDFLLLHASQTVQVVNVKPAARLADPAVAEALAWPDDLFRDRGWGHEIWTGTDPVLLSNVRFLAGYRRPGMPPDAVTAYEQAPDEEKSFGDEAGSRTDLAIARVRTGNLEGAREAVRPVLDLPVALRIHGVVTSVLDVHRAVTAQAADAPLARDIQEEIETYCRTPAAALPR